MKVDLAVFTSAVIEKSWQARFTETLSCHKCSETARLGFVVHEGIDADDRQNPPNLPRKPFLCNLRQSRDHIWPHDCVACATYFCPNCGHASTEWNQA